MYMLYHEENIGYSYMYVCTCMYVLCFSVNTCTHSVVGPSYFVVWFSVDDTISMIPRKLLAQQYRRLTSAIKWSNGEVLMATVLAAD